MKINNRGWGIGMMLGLMGILIFAILTAWYYSYQLFAKIDNIKDKESSSKTEVILTNYDALENKVKAAAKLYVERFNYECNMLNCVIRHDDLINNGVMTPLIDQDGNDCEGYASFNRDVYKGYIKCNNYETRGY